MTTSELEEVSTAVVPDVRVVITFRRWPALTWVVLFGAGGLTDFMSHSVMVTIWTFIVLTVTAVPALLRASRPVVTEEEI